MMKKKKPIWLVLIYIFIMAIGFMDGAWSVPWYLKYLAQISVVLLAFCWLLFSGDFSGFSCIGTYFAMNVIPFIGIIAISVFYWLLDLQTMTFISRGCSSVLYLIISLFAVSAAVYLFGGASIEYTMYSMVLANIGVVLYSVKRFGIQAFITGLIIFAKSGGIDTTPAIKTLEVHDLTFAFGLYIIYYLLVDENKKRWLYLAVTVVFFLLGFKRIAVLGMGGSLMIHLALSRFSDKARVLFIRWLTLAGIAVCLFYVYFIHSPLFNAFVDYYGIDTMGRKSIYDFFKPYYEITPMFRGYGIGFVSRTCNLMSADRIGIFRLFQYGGMHNDIVTFYIELGFTGFLLWVWYELYFRIMWITKKYGVKIAKILVYGTIYTFVTYATDNTIFYCYINTIFMLLPMAYAVKQQEAEGDAHETLENE